MRDSLPEPFEQASGAERDEPLRRLGAAPGGSLEASDTRLGAAIHLAGHAVAAETCGLGYPELRLEAAPDAVGCGFAPRAGPEARDSGGRGPARNAIEAAIIASLAGSEAERLAGGAPAGSCLDAARLLTDGDPREAEPYLEWLRLKAERTVEHPLRQRVILAVARALLERGALSGAELEALAQRETALYMRGQ